GDVGMDLHERAVGEDEIARFDRGAVGALPLDDPLAAARAMKIAENPLLPFDMLRRAALTVFAALGVIGDDLAIEASRRHEVGRQVVEGGEKPVAGLQAALGIEQRDALIDAVEGGLQQRRLLRQLNLAFLQLGDIGMNADDAPIGGLALADLDMTTVVGLALEDAARHAMIVQALGDHRLDLAYREDGGIARDGDAQEILEAGADRDELGNHRIQIAITFVEQRDAVLLVMNDEALRD